MLASDGVAYVLTLVVLTLAPGPLVLLLLVRAAGNDVWGAIGFGLGVAIGDVLVILAVTMGLGAWLQAAPSVHVAGQGLLGLYIGWLAHRIWVGKFDITEPAPEACAGLAASILAGAATCIISPQTIALYTLLLPQLVEIETIGLQAFLMISGLTFAALAMSFALVIVLADRVRRLTASERHVTWINRALALVLVAAGIWMLAA